MSVSSILEEDAKNVLLGFEGVVAILERVAIGVLVFIIVKVIGMLLKRFYSSFVRLCSYRSRTKACREDWIAVGSTFISAIALGAGLFLGSGAAGIEFSLVYLVGSGMLGFLLSGVGQVLVDVYYGIELQLSGLYNLHGELQFSGDPRTYIIHSFGTAWIILRTKSQNGDPSEEALKPMLYSEFVRGSVLLFPHKSPPASRAAYSPNVDGRPRPVDPQWTNKSSEASSTNTNDDWMQDLLRQTETRGNGAHVRRRAGAAVGSAAGMYVPTMEV